MIEDVAAAIKWLNGLGYHIGKDTLHAGTAVIMPQVNGGFKYGLVCADQCGGKVKVIQLKFVPKEEGSHWGTYEPEVVVYDYTNCYELKSPELVLRLKD
jgi:hypothetical protein